MDGFPPPGGLDPGMVRYLRRLVTALTVTMIVGLLVLIGLIVIRVQGGGSAPAPPALPDTVTLPEGARATAFTQGPGWFAVVTEDEHILIYDSETGALRQIVRVRR